MDAHHDNHHHIENDSQFAGLTVNNGVAQPPSVNPYLKARRRARCHRPANS